MFIKLADIDLFQFASIQDFFKHCLVSIDQIKQLFDDNQGQTPLPVQIEQFVLDQILQVNTSSFVRETFRDEALIDLYTSFIGDLFQWPSLTHQQVVCMLTLLHGLLCQIERSDYNHVTKLNEAFVHACSILMMGKDKKKTGLFNAQQYPQVIDYVVRTIFQHQNLYRIMLDKQPIETHKIEETRTIDFHIFEEPLFPYPLIESLPLSTYREVILQIPPSPLPSSDSSDLMQPSQASLFASTVAPAEVNKLNRMFLDILEQYPDLTKEQIQQVFIDVARAYQVEHEADGETQLSDKEQLLLEKFKTVDSKE